MADLGNFNAEEVQPSTGFECLPSGDYIAVINESEMKPTRSGTGEYLQLEFEIIEGEYSGRKLWTRLNLENQNQKAKEIARAELSAICHAIGVLHPRDSVELHNIPMTIIVSCKKNKETDELQNVIKGYKSKAAYVSCAAASASASSASASAAAAVATPPWARKNV